MKKRLPYLNKSLTSLKGERWKDVPDFEGIYKVSNFGRVKSLDRIILHPRLKEQFVAGRILSQSVAKNRNIKTGEPMIDLACRFQKMVFNIISIPVGLCMAPLEKRSTMIKMVCM